MPFQGHLNLQPPQESDGTSWFIYVHMMTAGPHNLYEND